MIFLKLKNNLKVKTKPLDGISEIQKNQLMRSRYAIGYELPILRGARNILDEVFLLEVETGLHKNYFNETTFEENFILFKEFNFMCMEIKQQPPKTDRT